MEKIGVVIPIYNSEKYLIRCIDSVINQSYKDISVVLVDDGSTDKSGEICDSYCKKDSRITVIHKKNEGNLRAIHDGVKILNCKYITCVDSDDWIDIDTYKELLDYIRLDIDVISYRMVRFFDNDNYVYTDEKYCKRVYTKNEIVNEIFPTMIWDKNENTFGLDPSLCNKIIKKELVEKYTKKACDNLYKGLNYAQDVAVIYPLMREVSEICFSQSGLYFHRQRINGDLPEYVRDPMFYEKTYSLYKYLMNEFCDKKDMLFQVEFFLADSVEFRLARMYKRKTIRDEFVFPFDKVEKGKRIILYGAGNSGRAMYGQIKKIKYCSIEAWVDKASGEKCDDFLIEAPEMILNYKYDYVVITVQDKSVVKEIKNNLSLMGINMEQVIS